jgi:translocation and assembly module TamB
MAGRLMKWAAWLVLAALVAVALAIGWLTQTESGLRWALARAVLATGGALAIEAPRGSFASGLHIRRLSYSDGPVRVDAGNVVVALELSSLLVMVVRAPLVSVESLEVAIEAGTGKSAMPESLGLPFRLHLDAVKIALARIEQDGTQVELRGASFAYYGSAQGHALRRLAFGMQDDTQVRADAMILARPPFSISAAVAGEGRRDGAPWRASASAAGSLASFKLEGSGEAQGAKAGLEAQIAAFDEMPVKRAALQLRDFDAARFAPGAPTTAIEAKLVLDPDAAGLAGTIALANAAAGDPGRGRLPLERATARVSWKDGVLAIAALDAAGGGATVRGALEVRGKRITTNELVAIARGGELRFSGAITIDDALPFEGRARFARFDPAAFGPFPAGTLNGEAELRGRAGAPREVDARLVLQPSLLRGAPLSGGGHVVWKRERIVADKVQLALGDNKLSADGALGFEKDALRVSFDLRAPALIDARLTGRLAGKAEFAGALDGSTTRMKMEATAKDVVVNEVKIDEARLDGKGSVARHSLALSARSGESTVAAAVAGGMKAGAWKGTLDSFKFGGRVPVQLIGTVPVQVEGGHVLAGPAQFALLESVLDVGSLEMRDGKLAATRGSFRGLAIAQLLVLSGRKLPGRATLKLAGDWSIEGGTERKGTLSVRRESGDMVLGEGDELALGIETLAFDARLAGGRVDAVARIRSRRADGTLEASVAALADGRFAGESPVDVTGAMQVADLAPFGAFLGTQARIGGRAAGTLVAKGTLARPLPRGEIQVDALEVSMPPEGVHWRDGSLKLVFSEDVTVATTFSVKAGEGTLRAEGRLAYDDEARSSLEWRATRFTVVSRPTTRLIASGSGTAALEKRRLALYGDVTVDSARIERGASALSEPGSDVVIVGAKAREERARRSIPVSLEAKVDLGGDFAVRTGGLDTQLRGRLQLESHSSSELVARGQVSSERGTFTAFGQRLAIERGVLAFDGPIDNPALDIQAMRRNQSVAAGVTVGGNLRAPVVRLVSEPSVPENEALFWLVLGRGPDEGTGADLGMLQIAASALLGDGRVLPTQALFAQLGIDSLQLRGGTSVQSQVVSVGKRISDRLYVTYEQGLAGAQTVLRLEYLLNNQVTLRAEAGDVSRVGVNYRYSFDEWPSR